MKELRDLKGKDLAARGVDDFLVEHVALVPDQNLVHRVRRLQCQGLGSTRGALLGLPLLSGEKTT